jgi:hypothetical protein
MRRINTTLITAAIACSLALSAQAQVTLTDLGGTPYQPGAVLDPTPGPDDISQMAYGAQNNDGINYYWDASDPVGACGQTFLTGSNPDGYTLTNLCIKTAGAGNANPIASQSYTLYIFSVSGSTATLLTSYTGSTAFQENHWMNISGLSVHLNPSSSYAYAFRRNGSGWEQLANYDGNYADGEICRIPTAGGTMTFGTARTSDAVFDLGLALGTVSPGGTVTFADLGEPGTPAAISLPTVDADDVYQTNNSAQNNNGLNYYFDNSKPVGQTFTTPPSASGWLLNSLSIKTAGGGGGTISSLNYRLYIYSVGANNTSVTQIGEYTARPDNGTCFSSFTQGDWIQWTNLGTSLLGGKKYAYGFRRDDPGGWEQMGTQSGNPYAGGDVCIVNRTTGQLEYGNGTNLVDAAFAVGLVTDPNPHPGLPLVVVPDGNTNIYASSVITLKDESGGAPPLWYQWFIDDGAGGAFTPISSYSTNNTLTYNTASLSPTLTYNVKVTVTNASSSATSDPLGLLILDASAPLLITNWVSPNTLTNFTGLSHTFAATIEGTLPLSCQWRKSPNADGSGATNIPGATNATLILGNLDVANTGFYSLLATNVVAPYSASTPWTELTVIPYAYRKFIWYAPVSFMANGTNTVSPAQVLSQPGTLVGAASFGTAASPITVNAGTNSITFTIDGSVASVADYQGAAANTFAYPLTTGNADFDNVLNQNVYNSPSGAIQMTLHNLTVDQRYLVQLFAVKNNELARKVGFQDPNNVANSSEVIAMESNSYFIGTFTAANVDEGIQVNLPFNNGGPGLGAMNAVVVRQLPTPSTSPATLQASLAGQTLNLSWNRQGWQLYSNAVSVSDSGSWNQVLGSEFVTNLNITIDPAKPKVFYQVRLK